MLYKKAASSTQDLQSTIKICIISQTCLFSAIKSTCDTSLNDMDISSFRHSSRRRRFAISNLRRAQHKNFITAIPCDYHKSWINETNHNSNDLATRETTLARNLFTRYLSTAVCDIFLFFGWKFKFV